MNADTAQVDDLRLIALPTAMNCTDIFVRFTLSEWSLRPLADEAAQTTLSMVDAAVQASDPKSPGFLTIRLRLRGDCLVIEVEDETRGHAPATLQALEGKRTGVEPLRGVGNRRWCELGLPPGMSASAVPLPRREKRRSPAAEALGDEPEELDPQVMQRLLSGLNNAGGGHRRPE
ncbi:ATP-binding protein [Saccharopolyspora sp. NPDC047091]|uniref:ATP-binding protein n=1 Tax=Saccharopolyspora sp. NPDC047091 TaxID=3155924 RepID=UPI0033E9686C